MKFKVDDFIEILGLAASNDKVKNMLSRLNLMAPVLKKGRDDVWLHFDNDAFELAFEDESLINRDEYADIGDGELIFMTVFFNAFDRLSLPFEIEQDDDAETVTKKIGREADDVTDFLSSKSWVFKTNTGLRYILFFDFYEDYTQIAKVGVCYSYGQMPWVEELKEIE